MAYSKNSVILYLIFLSAILFALFKLLEKSQFFTEDIEEVDKNPLTRFSKFGLDKMKKKNDYYKHCMSLYKKLRNPDPNLIKKPPLRKIPSHMLNDFLDNGNVQLGSTWYFDDAYSDASSDDKNKVGIVTNGEIENYLKKVKNNEPLNYDDKRLNYIMHQYDMQIKDKSFAVVGTQYPWVEAIALDAGASLITTLDYTRKRYEYPNLEWLHVNDFLDDAIENSKFEIFDNAASFSSIEHSGLGRYGDPLSPYGDFEAVQQIHCMLKPNGVLFLALPYRRSNLTLLQFNAHRVYGDWRLKKLFEGWDLELQDMDSAQFQGIFVLRKKSLPFQN